MGNTNCGRCLARESEMIAEILLGKNDDKKEAPRESNGAIKNISEEMPLEKMAGKYVNDLHADNKNNYFSKNQNNQNQYNLMGKGFEQKQINSSKQKL